MSPMKFCVAVVLVMLATTMEGQHHRILLDTDVDTDDVFALLYLLKLNRSEFQLEVRTPNQIQKHMVYFLYLFSYFCSTVIAFIHQVEIIFIF